ncbi:MAG: Nramp family divalent metal transporter [Armatimonadetes bacterium]|nr:Nramp family divalent metal transporter [Armatimonadota bacterium]
MYRPELPTERRNRRRGPIRSLIPYLGPAFMVSVGYMDPGNWGTNIAAGSRFGYTLLWVLLMSNLMALLLQTMAAKLGLITGRTLAGMCRDQFSPVVNWFLWIIAEIAMMATDLAEFLGASLGFTILFGWPLLFSGVVTAVVVFGILSLYKFGFRYVELTIASMVAIIALAYVVQLFIAPPEWAGVARGVLIPHLSNSDALMVAIGMLGATVMPHNLYLHSGLVQARQPVERTGRRHRSGLRDLHTRKLFRLAVLDSLSAMNGAWLVNSAMVIVAASAFHFHNPPIPVESITVAHQTLGDLFHGTSQFVFGFALLMAGISSSATGTLAGQIVYEGFMHRRMNVFLRRFITMAPAITVLVLMQFLPGRISDVDVLVWSQVCLSFALPFAIIPLVLFTQRKDLMREHRNLPLTNVLAWISTAIVVGLNLYLLWGFFAG